MHCIVPFCLLCFVVLQQIINVTSIISLENKSGDEIKRLLVARRLRAPLMGRSLTTTTTIKNDITYSVQPELNNIDHNDKNQSINIDKRRHSLVLLGRRKWMKSKGKGPLFG